MLFVDVQNLCKKHAELLNRQPALVTHHNHMRQKVTVSCLLNLVFQLPPDNRKLTLEEIAAATKLPLNDIELLIMKALSVNLIRGIIDQVQGILYVTWVRPRVLDSEQVSSASISLPLPFSVLEREWVYEKIMQPSQLVA